MKKTIFIVTFILTFLICVSLIIGYLSRMNQQAVNEKSEIRSDSDNRTEDENNKQESETIYTEEWSDPVKTEQWAEIVKTEQWAEIVNTEQWSDSYDDNAPFSDKDSGEKEKEQIKQLYGTWYIWIPSGALNLYDKETGEYVTHEFSEGSYSGIISVKENGKYSMRHDLWGKDETVQGEWRLSSPEEINGENTQAIILINGVGGTNWAVAPSPNDKIRLLQESEWDEKSSLWMFDSELYRK
jgi:hypothetical protein